VSSAGWVSGPGRRGDRPAEPGPGRPDRAVARQEQPGPFCPRQPPK